MRHCVFCASNECADAINIAKQAMDCLDMQWMLEHDCILQSYHSEFWTGDGDRYNTAIYLENDDIHQLINDCMEFAILNHELRNKNK